MLKIITSAATGLLAAGAVGYGYVQKANEHTAALQVQIVALTAQVKRRDEGIDAAIKALRAAKSDSLKDPSPLEGAQ
jgi:alpha-D-ribose 1-methylphosphonate 5-triphosphate synthase subunit PhnG